MPASRRAQIGFQPAKVQDNDSDDSWGDASRAQQRFVRIRSRVPTGHPVGLPKRVAAARRELAEDVDDQEEQLQEREYSSDEAETTAPPPSSNKRSRKHWTAAVAAEEEGSDGMEGAPSKHESKLAQSTSKRATIERSSVEKKKKSSKPREGRSLKEGGEKEGSSKSSKKKSKPVEYESESEVEPQVIVKPAKVKKQKARPKAGDDAVHMGNATFVDDDGDSSWGEENRHQERFRRIRKRVPTGHPKLATKVPCDEIEVADPVNSDDDQIRVCSRISGDRITGYSSDENDVPTGHRSHKGGSSSRRSKATSSTGVTKKSGSSSKKSGGLQFGETTAVDEDDEGWGERHEERFTRIRARVPTGHPGLAKKIAQLRMQMDEEEEVDDESSAEEIRVEKAKKKISKPSSNKTSSKKVRA